MGENRKQVNAILRRQRELNKPPLSRGDIEDLHSVLRRAAERAERRKDHPALAKMRQALAELEDELNGNPSYADPPFACPPDEAK